MTILGYEVHHTDCGGLIRGMSCSKCRGQWNLLSYLFNFGEFYHVKVGVNKRKERKEAVKEKIRTGELGKTYPVWVPYPAIIFVELLPRWPRSVRILIVGGVVFLLVYVLWIR